MDQQVKAPVTLAEDERLVLSILMAVHKPPVTPAPGGRMPSSGLCSHFTHDVHADETLMHFK